MNDEMIAARFPPEMVDRLRVLFDEMSALWAPTFPDADMAPTYAAAAMADKLFCMAGAAVATAEGHDGKMDVAAVMHASALSLGNVVALDWCCIGHAVEKLRVIGQTAMSHASAQSHQDRELNAGMSPATECKGTA